MLGVEPPSKLVGRKLPCELSNRFGQPLEDQGADMNVRGGQPGFVKALGQGRYIAWPDYVGTPG